MLDQQVAFDCRTEIIELHRFFTEWLGGVIPDTDATWSALENGLAPTFALITPRGDILEREPLLASLRPMHGRHAPEAGFKISIRAYACRHVDDDLIVVTYEEWQTLHGAETGRVSTAVFERNPAMPNRVRWLHVHETALPAD
ncbi:MAG: DUF4440 domain-containing protein [Planctomycetota bacterium]|nr:DUF4440 domain-containing protein [Planctomycetota bacterium]